ncbi:MAG: hypothetical protein KGN79_10570 [Acidobacteriota bacterium]|nr:hypothetical protein [Acidobacteriota bacterium]
MASTTAASTQLRLVPAKSHHNAQILFASRRISPEAGRALELLSHAVEYLSDQYVRVSRTFSASDPDVQAIQVLMAANSEVYFDCPVMPTIGERLRTFFGQRTA